MLRCLLVIATVIAGGACRIAEARADGELELKVVEQATGEPQPVRVHLQDARRRPIRSKGLGLAARGDHFYIDGVATLGLRRGQYRFVIDPGWEFNTVLGDFEIVRRADDSKTVETKRFANLHHEGWYGADLDAAVPLVDLRLVLRAEQLKYAPVTGWTGKGENWKTTPQTTAGREALSPGIGVHAARLDLKDGALLFVRTDQPLETKSLPSADDVSLAALRDARESGYRVIAADITSWRLPLWLAGDVLDAAVVIDRTSQLDSLQASLSKGRPAPSKLFPGRLGPGRWREAIYFHLLNTGLRVPAVAGSGAGTRVRGGGGDSPLGTNRVYAFCRSGFPADGFDAQEWWEAVDAGRTVVTNGPLLRPLVQGAAPGFSFPTDNEGHFQAKIGLNLTTRGTVEYLEVIQDGEPVINVSLRDFASSGGKLPPLDFDGSGWFAVRAVTTNSNRYQLALSGPYFVEQPGVPRISQRSCQFFLDWLDELEAERPRAASEDISAAREFWQTQLARATAP